MSEYVIGVDYGTDSCRSVVIDTSNGKEISSSVFPYPRWAAGKYCVAEKSQFRQHPLDYVEGLETSVKNALEKITPDCRKNIRGIAIDTTGSTPAPIDKTGTPLAMSPEFAENPNAMFVLWKDHTSTKEAAQINDLARSWGGVDYTKYCGGVYSSEWFWAKILHVIREDQAVRKACHGWAEHCDWMPALLTGCKSASEMKRSRCAAGHKAMWHHEFGGLPSEEFLTRLDPLLSGMREKLFSETYTSDVSAGSLCAEWAQRLGLSTDVKVAVGAFDAHMGAVGAQITPGALVKVIGTSTCDILIDANNKEEKVVKGICGQVDGSVIPGYLGLEAGQSAFGDSFAWFKRLLMWPLSLVKENSSLDATVLTEMEKLFDSKILPELEKKAESIRPSVTSPMALDWLNGRRTPNANQSLKAAIFNLNLGSDAPAVYRAIVESTAFGARAISECFESQGVKISEVIAIGGVSKKSSLVMQILSDVLNKKIKVATSLQTVALGSAMFASVAGGVYKDIPASQAAIGQGFEKEYSPRKEYAEIYDKIYQKFCKAGAFVESITGVAE